ncbi:MAG TPA: shikimate kinase [Bacteroidota bacterium]|nr:shikimate kinase [Bacteroidota bacterium]
MPERIYITGFMGSGKSTVGPLLARGLGYQFIDLDAVIEEKEGRSIPELFDARGESEFRAIEQRELALLEVRERIVVATGGGALTNPSTLDVVRRSGTLLYLNVDQETLFKRLRGVRGRPMISDASGRPLSDDALRERIKSLFAEREPLYKSADIVVDGTSLTPEATVTSILTSLRA